MLNNKIAFGHFLVTIGITLFLSRSVSALVIDTAGHYVIDSRVDEILISDRSISHDVSIEVVSGGVVEGNIQCAGGLGNECYGNVVVSGNGVVQGRLVGGFSTLLRDNAWVGMAGSSWSPSGGRTGVTIQDNAYVDQLLPSGQNTPGRINITGGYVNEFLSAWADTSIIMSGGIIDSSVTVPEDLYMNLSGGQITGGVSATQFSMGGGQIDGGISSYTLSTSNHSYITDGILNTNSNDYLIQLAGLTNLSISGGDLGGIESGLGIYLFGGATLNIYAQWMEFEGNILSGYLEDWNWFSVPVVYASNWGGELNIYSHYQVPESSTFALLSCGLLALGAIRMKSRTWPDKKQRGQ